MSDLLFSEDLEEYRKREIEEAVSYVFELYRGNITQDYFMGAMETLKKIVRLPAKMARTPEEKQQAEILIAKALDDYGGKLAKKILMEE